MEWISLIAVLLTFGLVILVLKIKIKFINYLSEVLLFEGKVF